MPSDPRVAAVLAALAQPIAEFRTLVRDALTRAEAYSSRQTAGTDERVTRSRSELGRFAERHIDPARFAALFLPARDATPASLTTLRRVIGTLQAVIARGDELFVVDVPPGSQVESVLVPAFGEIGRAFGAVILTDLIRTGRYRAEAHDRYLDPLKFSAWNSAERRVAPPLVVTLSGADLHAGELMTFADGREKIVLVVRAECAPAPLVRCITPGTLVLQTTDGQGLDRVAAFDGPAIAAMVPEGAATFLHDPGRGSETWQRLAVNHAGVAPKRSIGGASVWQMMEDLALLTDLSRIPVSVASRGSAAGQPAGEVVDRIAAWLLGQPEPPVA